MPVRTESPSTLTASSRPFNAETGSQTTEYALIMVVARISVACDADRRTNPPAHLEHITRRSTVASDLHERRSAQR